VREPPPRGLAFDACVAVALLGATFPMVYFHAFRENDRPVDAIAGALVALSALPLAARRIVPLAVLALVTAGTVGLYALGYGFPPVGFAVALYTVAEKRELTSPRARRAVLLAAAAAFVANHLVDNGLPGVELLFGALVWAAAWFAGERTRMRRERMAELEERALRAEREAERERRLAVAEERTRIARELHDSAGHAVNVILVQAGAARLLHRRDPDAAARALATIEDVARETIMEIDRLVRVLRRDEEHPPALAEVEPPAGLAALETLIERHRAAGLDVAVEIHGPRRQLPSRVDRAAYRILQEAMTNAARHGEGTASVEIAFGDDALDITVTNPPLPGSSRRAQGGHGLIGMRERAALLSGTLEAGAADGVFRVHACLPYDGPVR
jgi:signal transduction histidine kinase